MHLLGYKREAMASCHIPPCFCIETEYPSLMLGPRVEDVQVVGHIDEAT